MHINIHEGHCNASWLIAGGYGGWCEQNYNLFGINKKNFTEQKRKFTHTYILFR